MTSVSAAKTRATASQASTPLNSHHNVPRARPVPCVEFIYTPDIRRFDLAFNDLCGAQSPWPQRRHRKCVDDLDSPPLRPSRAPLLQELLGTAECVKTSHNGHCVTLELRPRYNMSHRRRPQILWHGCCFYNNRERQSYFGKEASRLADSNKARTGNEPSGPSDTAHVPDKNKNISTSRRPITPRPAGFFLSDVSGPLSPMRRGHPAGRSFIQAAALVNIGSNCAWMRSSSLMLTPA